MDLKHAFDGVLNAMDTLSHAFSEHLEELRRDGKSEEEMQALVRGALAMKDAASIYLSWAKHYLSEFDRVDGWNPDDESILVDE